MLRALRQISRSAQAFKHLTRVLPVPVCQGTFMYRAVTAVHGTRSYVRSSVCLRVVEQYVETF